MKVEMKFSRVSQWNALVDVTDIDYWISFLCGRVLIAGIAFCSRTAFHLYFDKLIEIINFSFLLCWVFFCAS